MRTARTLGAKAPADGHGLSPEASPVSHPPQALTSSCPTLASEKPAFPCLSTGDPCPVLPGRKCQTGDKTPWTVPRWLGSFELCWASGNGCSLQLKFSLCSSRLCFFLIFVFNWRIIALQCHAGFCCLCRKLSETVTCLGAPSCRTVPIVFTCVPSGRAESDVSMSPVFSLAVLTAINLVGGGGAKARARPELGLLRTVASITLFGPGVSLKLLEQKPPGPL